MGRTAQRQSNGRGCMYKRDLGDLRHFWCLRLKVPQLFNRVPDPIAWSYLKSHTIPSIASSAAANTHIPTLAIYPWLVWHTDGRSRVPWVLAWASGKPYLIAVNLRFRGIHYIESAISKIIDSTVLLHMGVLAMASTTILGECTHGARSPCTGIIDSLSYHMLLWFFFILQNLINYIPNKIKLIKMSLKKIVTLQH